MMVTAAGRPGQGTDVRSSAVLDAASYPALWAISDSLGIRPEWVLPALWIESRFSPSVPNAQGYPYYGLNQIAGTWLQAYGITPADYLTWSASKQLQLVVGPYFAQQQAKFGPLRSGTRLYQSNFYPASLATARMMASHIVCKPNAAYNANTVLDADHSGCITVGDLAYLVGQAALNPSVKAALAATYALRPTQTPTNPALGTDFSAPSLQAPTVAGLTLLEGLVGASALASLVLNAPKFWR